MTNNELYRKIDAIVENHKDNKPIVAILQDVQEEYRYIPREAFDYLAEKLDVSLAKLFSIATFYENFSLTPKGKYVIKICDGTACHVRKSIPILNALKKNSSWQTERKQQKTCCLPLRLYRVLARADWRLF